MTVRFKAVIFDLDGTLADSAPDIAAALNVALIQLGQQPLPLAEITKMVGGGARLLAERGLASCGETPSTARIDELYAAFHTAYEKSPAQLTTLYPGARAALDRLQTQNISLGICTNKPAPLTQPILEVLGIRARFGSVVSAAPDLALKPDAAMLRRVLDDLAVQGSEAIMIGDSAADVGTARAAGVPVILVSHGYTTVPASHLGADGVIDHFDDLIPALAKFVI